MKNPNIGWLFYKDYYKGIEYIFKDDSEKDRKNRDNRSKMLVKNENLLKMVINETIKQDLLVPNTSTFSLKTSYPGLLIGSGYNHAVGAEGEFKIGFFFDHCTGSPIIPGSSVKGLLRSAFPQQYIIGKKAKYQVAKTTFILKKLTEINPLYSNIDVDIFEQIIFDGYDDTQKDDFLPISKRIIFHDAIISSVNQSIFEQDFITPHKSKLKEPIPIMFLKIKPDVSFTFQFELKPIIIKEIEVSVEELKQLFKSIIKTLGIGAKTNVGYGALS